ncbi:MAG: hypothetical protein GC204_15465 [Chloroflexi bacterium]|nr:hypothetical protein [Chloroflexota bacterium]
MVLKWIRQTLLGQLPVSAQSPDNPVHAQRLKDVMEKISAQGGHLGYFYQAETRPVLLSLEDFFMGNPDDFGSIAANLPDHPGRDRFFALLKTMRSRDAVQDVRVMVTQLEDDPYPDAVWPYSDQVVVLAEASQQEVSGWFQSVEPDVITDISPEWKTWQQEKPAFFPELKAKTYAFSVWWD